MTTSVVRTIELDEMVEESCTLVVYQNRHACGHLLFHCNKHVVLDRQQERLHCARDCQFEHVVPKPVCLSQSHHEGHPDPKFANDEELPRLALLDESAVWLFGYVDMEQHPHDNILRWDR